MLPVGNNVTNTLTSRSFGKMAGGSIEIINEALDRDGSRFFTDGSGKFCLMLSVENAIQEFVIKSESVHLYFRRGQTSAMSCTHLNVGCSRHKILWFLRVRDWNKISHL
jgi:hypothetical protein